MIVSAPKTITILVAGLLGPKYAMLTGVLGSITSGMTFDMYSFYYAPVQLLTGFFAGILYHGKWLKGWRTPLGSILVGVPTSLLSACITAGLFNGITSGASSTFVVVFHHLGMPLVLSILLVQVFDHKPFVTGFTKTGKAELLLFLSSETAQNLSESETDPTRFPHTLRLSPTLRLPLTGVLSVHKKAALSSSPSAALR